MDVLRARAYTENAERERDREHLEQLKSPDVVANASRLGTNAPRENRPITGHVVDDHEDHGAGDGLGTVMVIIGGGEQLVLVYLYRATR